jgi:hypothetical protein
MTFNIQLYVKFFFFLYLSDLFTSLQNKGSYKYLLILLCKQNYITYIPKI